MKSLEIDHISPKISMRYVIYIMVIFVLSFNVDAATYYVDYANGNDSNNGTSTSTPWKHSPRDVGLTLRDSGNWRSEGNAKTTVLAPGDVVFFKRGVTYRGYIQLQTAGTLLKSGTTGNITDCAKGGNCTLTDSGGGFTALSLTNNTTSPYGSDLVYIYNAAAATDGLWVGAIGMYEVVSTDSNTQLTIKNISTTVPKFAYSGGDMTYQIIRPVTLTSRPDWGTGEATLTAILDADSSCVKPCTQATAPNSPDNIIRLELNYNKIANLTFKDTKYPPDYAGGADCTGSGDFGVFGGVVGTQGKVFLHNNKFQDTWRNTHIAASAGFVAIDNTVSNTRSMAFEGVSLAEGNTIQDIALCFDGPLSYSVIRSNKCINATLPQCQTHQNGIRSFGGVTYVWVIGNFFKDTFEGIYLSITNGGTSHFSIVNNVFIGDYSVGADFAIYANLAPYTRIYNNTIVGYGTTGHLKGICVGSCDGPNNPSPNSEIKNNIVYSTVANSYIWIGTGDATSAASLISDYNVIYVPNHRHGKPFQISGVEKTWAEWQAAGFDIHGSISQPLLGHPTGTVWSDFDLIPQYNDTVAKSKGTRGLLNFDINNTPRLQGTTWDIGAYINKPSKPSPPLHLKVY